MAYIRDNIEYLQSLGFSYKEAKAMIKAEEDLGHDGGYCNPRKVKEYDETVQDYLDMDEYDD